MFEKVSFPRCKFGLILFPVLGLVEVWAERSKSKAKNATTNDGSNGMALSKETLVELARALAKFARLIITVFGSCRFLIISLIYAVILPAKGAKKCAASFGIGYKSKIAVKQENR